MPGTTRLHCINSVVFTGLFVSLPFSWGKFCPSVRKLPSCLLQRRADPKDSLEIWPSSCHTLSTSRFVTFLLLASLLGLKSFMNELKNATALISNLFRGVKSTLRHGWSLKKCWARVGTFLRGCIVVSLRVSCLLTVRSSCNNGREFYCLCMRKVDPHYTFSAVVTCPYCTYYHWVTQYTLIWDWTEIKRDSSSQTTIVTKSLVTR